MGNRQGKLGGLRKIAARVLVEPEPQARGPHPLMVLAGTAELTADVILDSDAQPRLAKLSEASPGPGGSRQVYPSLARPADDGEQVEVCMGSHRIGTLSAADSAGFWSFLDKAKSQGRRVHVMALGDQDASGAWALRIYLPHPQPGQDRPAPPAGE